MASVSPLRFFLFLYFAFFSTSQVLGKSTPLFACDVKTNPSLASFGFCNVSLGVTERVADLVKRLTLHEKFGFLLENVTSVSRLGIPIFKWLSEGLHGVSSGGFATHFNNEVPAATIFPQVILTAASFNASLFEAIGKAVSTEARAMHNLGLTGLSFWAPNVNIFRDPRWGRGQETPGEDPKLSSEYASSFVRGMQGRDSDKLKVAAYCKHYTAYDLESWNGTDRFHFNAVVTKQDLEDTFQPPIRSCVVDGNAAGVICSYNQVNGKPACADADLLSGVIRGQLELNGSIVSDCEALKYIYIFQHYTKTPEETVAKSILAGLDLNCVPFLGQHIDAAVQEGLVNESAIDRAISNNIATLMRLGFFDGDPREQLYGNLGPKDVCSPEHQELALEAGRQGIVVLKNSPGSLPLSSTAIKNLAVIGPNANITETMLGSFYGPPCKYTTPLKGQAASVAIAYEAGCFGSSVSCIRAELDGAKC